MIYENIEFSFKDGKTLMLNIQQAKKLYESLKELFETKITITAGDKEVPIFLADGLESFQNILYLKGVDSVSSG